MRYTIQLYQEAAPTDLNWLFDIRHEGKLVKSGGGFLTAELTLSAAAIALQQIALAEMVAWVASNSP